MSVSGLCQICEAAEGRYACPQCGTVVCDDHYDREHGMCTQCAARFRGTDGPGPDGPRTL